MPLANYSCSACGKTPAEAAIHRTSPKGESFEGMCSDCLGEDRPQSTFGDRLADALEPIRMNDGTHPLRETSPRIRRKTRD